MERVKSFTDNKKVGQIASDTDKIKQDATGEDNKIQGLIATGQTNIHKAMSLTMADNLVNLTTLPDGNSFSGKHHGEIVALQEDEAGAQYLYRDGRQSQMSKESAKKLRQELEEIDTRSFPSIRTTKCSDCLRMIPDGIEHLCANTNVYTEVGPQQMQPTAPLMPVQNINMAAVKNKTTEQDKRFTTRSRDPNRKPIHNENKTTEDQSNMKLLLETVIGLNKTMTLMQAKMEKMEKRRHRRQSSSSSSDSSSSPSRKEKHERHSRPVLKKTSQYDNDKNDIDFGDYLSRSGNKERLRNIPQLVHSQGPTYSKWLSVLQKQMKLLGIPDHLYIPLAINKVPAEIRVRVLDTPINTDDDLEELLHTIYCGAMNSTNLIRNYKKTNKMAPHDRDYDKLRDTILNDQVPTILSVQRIGKGKQHEVREALIEQATFTRGTELFLDALQRDARTSILNKGPHDSVDELVQRANDFASSIDNDYTKPFVGIVQDRNNQCRVHPHLKHSQQECRNKCPIHPYGSHTAKDCRTTAPTNKCPIHPNGSHTEGECRMQHATKTSPKPCPPERAGIHGHPMWCAYCNNLLPKNENNKCPHCWKHSTKDNPVTPDQCQCEIKRRTMK